MVERYDWDYARTIIEEEFGEQLRRGGAYNNRGKRKRQNIR
jgi:hypothetical protein